MMAATVLMIPAWLSISLRLGEGCERDEGEFSHPKGVPVRPKRRHEDIGEGEYCGLIP